MNQKMSLQERIEAERIVKATANPRSFKQLGRNPQSLNFSMVIQRNHRWTDIQKSELIESVLLGYPIPPIYAVKSDDNITWVLDGKQRVEGAIIPFMNNEYPLVGLTPVYEIDVNGMYFKDLPIEFQDILEEERINVYQFEKLSPAQRDKFFRKLNSGTPLTKIELIRSILGEDILTWIGTITAKPFFNIITENGREKFLDVEMVLQMLAILQKEYGKMGGTDLIDLALKYRVNNIAEDLKEMLSQTIDYLNDGFKEYEEKEKKKILKKNDCIALVGAGYVSTTNGVDPKVFAGRTGLVIVKPSGDYKNTKIGGTSKPDKVKRRVELLIASVVDEFESKNHGQEGQTVMNI
ncbi:DUF262 domain-containing protein [Paenibacillus sp. M.A.Huq-81]